MLVLLKARNLFRISACSKRYYALYYDVQLRERGAQEQVRTSSLVLMRGGLVCPEVAVVDSGQGAGLRQGQGRTGQGQGLG